MRQAIARDRIQLPYRYDLSKELEIHDIEHDNTGSEFQLICMLHVCMYVHVCTVGTV